MTPEQVGLVPNPSLTDMVESWLSDTLPDWWNISDITAMYCAAIDGCPAPVLAWSEDDPDWACGGVEVPACVEVPKGKVLIESRLHPDDIGGNLLLDVKLVEQDPAMTEWLPEDAVARDMTNRSHQLWQELLDFGLYSANPMVSAGMFEVYPGDVSVIEAPPDEDLFCGGPITVAVNATGILIIDDPGCSATSDELRAWAESVFPSRMENAQDDGPTLVPIHHDVAPEDGVCRKCKRTMIQIVEDPVSECLLQIDFSSVTRGVVGG